MHLKGIFSNRELDVIRLIVFEYTTQEIANALFLSYDTIKTHRKNIIRKLKVKNTAGIVRKAFEIGIITTDSNSTRIHLN